MPAGGSMRHCMPCIALVAAMGQLGVQAADREEAALSAYREQVLPRPPHGSRPLRFQAPPSQLLDPWRCGVGNGYGRPPSAASCAYDPRLAPDFLLDYPFASVRLMPPLRPAPAPGLNGEPAAGEPVPGAPPSQLPSIIEPPNLFLFLER